jgi:spore maturation protein CgeB
MPSIQNKLINSLFYLGSLNKNSNSYRRFQTYKQLVSQVEGLDIEPFIYESITKRFDHHFNFGLGTLKLNAAAKAIEFSKFDLLLIDNRPFLYKSTLNYIRKKYPNLKIALVLTDDPNGQYKSGWRLLKKTASLIDIHFVQRKTNVQELFLWGANNVEMCYRSYDLAFHRKKPAIEKNKNYNAGFIGSYEEQREESIKFLIEKGIKVKVIGDGWAKGKHFDLIKPYYGGPSVYGELYVDCINSMQLALHFLRVGNRDEQDSRTFEIPACGTPMIAEYSSVHASLFNDNEVLFFKKNEELLDKVRYFTENPQIAAEYAERAARRCVEAGYDHKSTLQKVLDKIQTV